MVFSLGNPHELQLLNVSATLTATLRHKKRRKDSELVERNNIKTQIVKKEPKKKTSDDLVKQLKDLNELYESGVLTEEEFSKAKKKLLN